ncbi:hypothetical protein B0A49_05023 [Cryomyces minteri]|uniref:Uncharacterized protein n=1 Tax=Cryomyces minteri TaxID=331657 RepID=A0A4U0XDE3_9PEZI|nr:hypothetical protein B0A49_05023 [Cryomyces minteri]
MPSIIPCAALGRAKQSAFVIWTSVSRRGTNNCRPLALPPSSLFSCWTRPQFPSQTITSSSRRLSVKEPIDGHNGRDVTYDDEFSFDEASDADVLELVGSHPTRGTRDGRFGEGRIFSDLKPSPSVYLIEALKTTGRFEAIPPEYDRRVDLSYNTPYLRRAPGEGGRRPIFRSEAPPELSLQSITANYIRNTAGLQDPLSVGPDDISASTILELELDFLKAKGFTYEDVKTWSRILVSKGSYRGAKLLLSSSSTDLTGDRPTRTIPVFVLLFFLRRKILTARTLRLLLIHTWERLQISEDTELAWNNEEELGDSPVLLELWRGATDSDIEAAESRQSFPTLDDQTVIILIVRLLRHARRVWPQALPNIAAVFIKHFEWRRQQTSDVDEISPERLSRLTFWHNKILGLLALPASLDPYKSIPKHERAQFDILRCMAEHSPPLAVTREGYRAIARVQLARKKTSREKDWASLKARSWPPWKEDKTAVDIEKGVEYGTSRAGDALNRMREAGYAGGLWAEVAGIYAGWDTDGSPTIQTRKLPVRVAAPTRARIQAQRASIQDSVQDQRATNIQDDGDTHHSLWIARIDATRTTQEAWACFLAYEDLGLSHPDVYQVTFVKLYEESKRLRRDSQVGERRQYRVDFQDLHPDEPLLAGDMKEVLPAPVSPNEATYVRVEPPTLEHLFDQMIEKGIWPSEKSLAYLVAHAPSLLLGIKFLRNGGKDYKAIVDALLSTHPSETDLGFCSDSVMTVMSPGVHPSINEIMTLKLMRRIMATMSKIGLDIDYTGFRQVCIGLERATIAALKITRQGRNLSSTGTEEGDVALDDFVYYDGSSTKVLQEATEVLTKGSTYIKVLFRALVGVGRMSDVAEVYDTVGGDPERPIPRVLAGIHPVVLHSYVRALGRLGDRQGLLELAEWMAEYQEELNENIREANNGRRTLRLVLTSMRVFLDGTWERHQPGGTLARRPSGESVVPDELLEKVIGLVDNVPEWGGWATDEEAESYSQNREWKAR